MSFVMGRRLMRSRKPGSACPMDQLLRLLTGPWTSYILWVLRSNGPTRFGELKRRVPGVSGKMLTERLRMVEEERVVLRPSRRGGRAVEGTRLESVHRGNPIAGSNPAPSATATEPQNSPGAVMSRQSQTFSKLPAELHGLRRNAWPVIRALSAVFSF